MGRIRDNRIHTSAISSSGFDMNGLIELARLFLVLCWIQDLKLAISCSKASVAGKNR